MGKRTGLAVGLLLALVLLAGCGRDSALSQTRWLRPEPLPEADTAAFLTALDFTGAEIARADGDGLCLVRQAEFTPDGDYRFSCDARATRAAARSWLDGFLSDLAADPAALAAVYDEPYGVDMAAMTTEECKAFYARLFGCENYEALLDHLADAVFDYAALAEWAEEGRYARRGHKLFFTGPENADRGYVEYALTETGLTLRFADRSEEYSPAE